jgi:hypothetical protein
MIGIMMVAVIGYANLQLWGTMATGYHKLYKRHAESYVQAGIKKLTDIFMEHLETHSEFDTKYGRFCYRFIVWLENQGRQLAKEKLVVRERKVARLEQVVEDAKLRLKEAREALNSLSMPDSTVGSS